MNELPLGTRSALCLGPCMDSLTLEMPAWGVAKWEAQVSGERVESLVWGGDGFLSFA